MERHHLKEEEAEPAIYQQLCVIAWKVQFSKGVFLFAPLPPITAHYRLYLGCTGVGSETNGSHRLWMITSSSVDLEACRTYGWSHGCSGITKWAVMNGNGR